MEPIIKTINEIQNEYSEKIKKQDLEYNIFKTLKLKNNEQFLHSRFLGDLLNPKGKHLQKDKFLKSFIEALLAIFKDSKDFKNIETLKNFNPDGAKVILEKDIGEIDYKNDKGGKIDIILVDRFNNKIIIENKIYAFDQKRQLVRYYNYDKKAVLLYLSLFGKSASIPSGDQINYQCISYKTFILDWLKENKPDGTDAFSIYYNQYLDIITELTKQSNKHKMKVELVNSIIENNENYYSAKEVYKQFKSAEKHLHLKFRKSLNEKLYKTFKDSGLDLDLNFDTKKQLTEFSINKFLNIESLSIKNADIIFQTSKMYLDDKEKLNPNFYYGVRIKGIDNNLFLNENIALENILSSNLNIHESKNWIVKVNYKPTEEIEKQLFKNREELIDDLSNEIKNFIEKLNT